MALSPLNRCRVLAGVAVTLSSQTAHSEPRLFVHLDYRTDAALSGCPDEAAFQDLVRAPLGYDPFRADAPYTVIARAHPVGNGIAGSVEWYDASGAARGERWLSSGRSDCAAFAQELSFAIVVQIQLLGEDVQTPDRVFEQPEPKEPPASTVTRAPPPNSAPQADRRPSPSPSKGEPARWRFMVGAGPALGFGVAPRTVVEGRIFSALRRDGLAVELGAEASLPSRYTTADGQGFEQRLALGSFAGCGFVGSFSGCLLNKLGRLEVSGFGVDAPRSSAGLLAQVGARLALNEGLGERWVGALRIEAMATLVPWRVTLNQRQIWSTPVVSLTVGADLAAIFHDNRGGLATIP